MAEQRDRNYMFDPLSEKIDLAWAGSPTDKKGFNNYYDYFFSGEDVKIYIDGLFDEEDELDIASFAYAVRQEKQPLYGFWSYNYDAMMYGTRLISGEFSIYTRHPRRMTELLAKATEKRVSQPNPLNRDAKVRSTLRNLDLYKEKEVHLTSLKDEKNINQFWSYSQLDRITKDPFSQSIVDSDKNIFSAHPPFNFIVMLGAEEVSLSPKDFLSSDDKTIEGNMDRMLLFDVNQRLVRPNSENKTSPMKIVLQEIQLIGMVTNYSVGGSPLVENYQFIARDFYFTEVDLGFIKNQVSSNSSEEPTKSDVNSTNVKEETVTNNSSSILFKDGPR
jgi:hypothetical protein